VGGTAEPWDAREALRAGAQFAPDAAVCGARRLKGGLIHRSFALRCESGPPLLLQRLNTAVFRDPERLMQNVARVAAHLRRQLAAEGCPDRERRCLEPIPSRAGALLHADAQGNVWRAFRFIEGAASHEKPEGLEQARRAAFAFGDFARRLADLDEPPLHETIPRFHDFAARVAALEAALRADPRGRARAARAEAGALRARCAEVMQGLAAQGVERLPRRVVHHDCKLENLLFDAASGEALCVIDLDTVMPGALLSDFGELVRSSTNTASEDEPDTSRVDFDLDVFGALASGYLAGVGPVLTPAEREALALAGPLLTLMNAVRFLTDHLEGDAYFAIERTGHNLDRARAQLRLAERMLAQQPAMRALLQASAGRAPAA
jgi:Ser/Thr protein kinase RdoA (MazF antagonist)